MSVKYAKVGMNLIDSFKLEFFARQSTYSRVSSRLQRDNEGVLLSSSKIIFNVNFFNFCKRKNYKILHVLTSELQSSFFCCCLDSSINF